VKILPQKLAFVQTLAELSDTWEVKNGVIDKWESFTCCIYGRPRFSTVDDLRYQMLKEKCGDEVISASHNITWPWRRCLLVDLVLIAAVIDSKLSS